MTTIIEIPKEDLYEYETGRIEMTSNGGVRMRFSRTKTHPFHLGVSVYEENAPKGTPIPTFYIPLDMMRDTGVYLTSVAVQMTHEWHQLTPQQQEAYNRLPVPIPNPGLMLVNRDDLQYLLAHLEEDRDTTVEMLNDPYAKRSMLSIASEEDIQADLDRMTDLLDSYELYR